MTKSLKNLFHLKKKTIILTSIIALFFVFLFLFANKAHAASIAAVLSDTTTADTLGFRIKNIWQILINLCNSLIVVVLIFVAFSQILRLNINTYGVKKILPTLILAIIAANFSFLFCRLMVDFASVIGDIFINGTGAGAKPGSSTPDQVIGAFTTMSSSMDIGTAGPKGYSWGLLFWYGVANLFTFAAAIILLILAYLFIIRSWMIYFLVSIAPLAFMALVLPQTKSLFNQWWSTISKWIFMPIASLFWIWLGAQWYVNIKAGGNFMTFVFVGVCYYLAITTPFKLGGAIMGQWAKVSKGAAKFGFNQYGGAASRMSMIGQNMEKRNPSGWKNTLGGILNRGGGVLNVPASVSAYKKGRQGYIEKLGKASMKTGTYQRFGGQAVQIEGMRAKNEEDLKQMGTSETANRVRDYEDALVNDANTNAGGVANNDLTKALANKGITSFGAATENQKRAAARQILASTGVDNILLKYRGIGGRFTSADDAVMAEGISKNFIQFERGNKTSGDLQTAYRGHGRDFATSAVGTKTGAQASIDAGMAQATDMADIDTAEALNAAAVRGDGKALEVIIKDFKPPAQEKLRDSYGKMLAGHTTLGKIAGEEFVNEAGNKADKTASIAKMIGSDGAAKKLTSLADHSGMTFDEALVESGVDISQLDPATQKAIKDTFENIRKSKDQMVKEEFTASQYEIEDELQGIKMVIDGANHRSIGLGRMKSEIKKSQQMVKDGNMAGARSVVEGVSGSLGVDGDKNIEVALEKRIEHLKKGVDHFDNFYKSLASISDPKDKKAVLEEARKMLQVNPGSYINDLRDKKSAEAKTDAEAKTAVHLASSNLATNPAIQNLPVAQMAINPVVLEEFNRAVSGMTDSLELHGEKLEELISQHDSSGASSGGALNKVASLGPTDMGIKTMMINALNASIQAGALKTGATIKDALSNDAFRKTLAKGFKSGFEESNPGKAILRDSKKPQETPIQTQPPTGPFKMPPE